MATKIVRSLIAAAIYHDSIAQLLHHIRLILSDYNSTQAQKQSVEQEFSELFEMERLANQKLKELR